MARVLVTDAGRGSAIAVHPLARAAAAWTSSPPTSSAAARASRRATPARAVVYPYPADRSRRRRSTRCTPRPCATSASTWSSRSATTSRCRCRAPASASTGLCALALPDPDGAARRSTDKAATIDLARRLGVPVPETALVPHRRRGAGRRAAAGLAAGAQAGRARAIVREDGRGALRGQLRRRRGRARGRAWRPLEGRTAVLLQEYRAGRGPRRRAAAATDGEPLAVFQHRRLHEVPITGGASALRESVPVDPVLLDHALRAHARAALDGPGHGRVPRRARAARCSWRSTAASGARCRWRSRAASTSRSGSRSCTSGPGRSAAGAVNGGPPRIGVRSRNLGLELVWIASVLRKERRYPVPRRRRSRADGLRAALRLAAPARRLRRARPRRPAARAWPSSRGVAGTPARKARHAALAAGRSPS